MKAYYDSFGGMMHVEALEYGAVGNIPSIKVRFNVSRGGYNRGEILWCPVHRVIPRAHYHKSRKGPFHFYTTPYDWKALLAA